MKGHAHELLPYPAQNRDRPMRTAAAKQGDADHLSLWAGQAAALARVMPAANWSKRLVTESALLFSRHYESSRSQPRFPKSLGGHSLTVGELIRDRAS